MSGNTFTYDSQLIDDYLLTAGIPLLSTTLSPTAVYINTEGRSELLAVHQDGELYQITRDAGSSSGWNAYGVGARLIYLAVFDAVTRWGVGLGSDTRLWGYSGNRWLAQAGTMPDQPQGLSVGTDGTLWCIDENNDLQQLTQNGWELLTAGIPQYVSSVSGSEGNLWIVDKFGGLNNVVDGAATPHPLPGGAQPGMVVAGADGRILALDQNGGLYQLGGGAWTGLSGAPASLSIIGCDASGATWGLDSAGSVHVLRAEGSWQTLPAIPEGNVIISFAVGVDGSVGVIDLAANIWKLNDSDTPSWERESLPTGMHGSTAGGGVTEVVTGQDASGVWTALFVQSGQIYSMTYGNGFWSVPLNIAGGSMVGLTNQLDTNELIGYGVSSNGNFMVMLYNGSRYAALEYVAQSSGMLSGVYTNLTVVNDDNWYTSGVIDGALNIALGSRSAPLTSPNLGEPNFVPMGNAYNNGDPMPTSMQQVIRLPWLQNQSLPYAAVLDTAGNLYMVFNMFFGVSMYGGVTEGYYNQIAGGTGSTISTVLSCAATIDANGMARLYATDDTGSLWVLRQTGSGGQPNDPWTWTLWHPLGNNCIHLTNGPSALNTTELFTIAEDNTLTVLDQDPTTKTWTTKQVKRPAGTGEEKDRVTLYKTEVTVLDENGAPAANAQVTITPAESALLYVAGREYDVAAGATITATTGARGTVTVYTPALGLHTPGYAIAAGGAALTAYPPQHVKDFLSGNAQRNGVTFDKNSLLNATDTCGNPYPLAPGLDANVAELAAMAITTISGLAPVAPAAPRPWRTHPENAGSVWDDLWSELEDFAEDVYHAIRNGVFKVVSATVDETTRLLSITLSFVKNAEQAVLTFIVDTAEHIANALHAAFAWIEAEVEKVIEWLKLLFEWKSILNTQKVISYYLGSAIPYLQNLVQNDAKPLVDGFFSSLEGTIDDGFSTLRSLLGEQQLSSVAKNPGMGSTIQIPSGFSFSVGNVLCGTQVNWLIEKVENFILGSGGGSISANAEVQSAWSDFSSRASTAWGELYDGIEQLRAFIIGAVKQPSDFAQLAASDLLSALQDVIAAALTFADGLIEAFLDVVTAVLGAMQSIFTQPMDIPIVSSLYHDLTGEELSAQTLFSLLMAFPLTIAYKLINGVSSDLFSDEQVQQITGGSVMRADMALGGLGASSLATAFQYCNAGVTLIWAAYDTVLDLFEEAPPLGFQIGDVIFPIALQAFGWPGGIPFGSVPMATAADRWAFGFWVTGWAPILVNSAMLVIGKLVDEQSQTARYLDPVGKGILMGIGLVSLGVGAAASGLGHQEGSADGATIAANTLSPMPNLFQWLRLQAVADSTDELTFILKPIVDFFTGAGTAVALFAEQSSPVATPRAIPAT